MKTAWIAVAAAWIAVALVAAGLHPALRDGAPLAGLGGQIAADAAQGRAQLATLFMPGGGWSLAFWALALSLLYIVGFALFRLCPRRVETSGVPVPLLVAALLGQVAACFAGNATVFYFLTCGVAAVSLVFVRRSPPPESRPSPIRLSLAMGVGLLFVVVASLFDVGLAQLAGARLLPEAWFPLAVEFGSRPMVGVILAVVVAAACLALSFARSGWLGLAPACVLVLGPSSPAKGLAAAAVVSLLGRSGVGPLWRAGFLALLTALFVIATWCY